MTFAVLAKKVSPTLKRIAFRLNSRFTFFDQDDLYQEALVQLWNDFNQGKLADKTESYILQGCYFHLKNYIRTHRDKANLVSLEAALSAAEESHSEEVLSFQKKEERPFRDYFHDKLLAESICKNDFTPREKAILEFIAEGLTTREIGARLGISHVRVIKVIRLIRDKSLRCSDKIS